MFEEVFLILLKIVVYGFFVILFLVGAALMLAGIGLLLMSGLSFVGVIGTIFKIKLITFADSVTESIKDTVTFLGIGLLLVFVGSLFLFKAFLFYGLFGFV